MNLDVPQFWHLTCYGEKKDDTLTDEEKEYMKRLHDNVIYIEVKDENMSYNNLAEIFCKFGDIKIVRESKNHFYVDFLEIDQDAVHGKNRIRKRNKDTIA